MPLTGNPLDPLSADEIRQATTLAKQEAQRKGLDVDKLRFSFVSMKEPEKQSYLAWRNGNSGLPPREAEICMQALPEPVVYELSVSLDSGATTSWKELTGVHMLATPDDCFLAESIVKQDEQFKSLLKERYGVEDMDLVACDPWSIHASPVDDRKVMQIFVYFRTSPDDNQYAHPCDMVPLVDVIAGKVISISKHEKPPPINWENSNYHQKLVEPSTWRKDIKPLDVVQPQGPSFSVKDSMVYWQKWSLHVGFNYREGLVLSDIAYEDRPVLHRISLVEMAVPYADPREPYVRKCAFDVGDYGLGYTANSLSLGCDCLGHIHYFDGMLSDSKGEPVHMPKVVCMHEEDVGLMWKHVDYRNAHNESRRARRLVISFISTVVNYEYCFYYYLYQDGTISFEIKLTGELSTNVLSPGEEEPEFGTLVLPHVNAQNHQHMFCARIDPAVDDKNGGKNAVISEVNCEAMPAGPQNPYGNGFIAKEERLESVSAAQRVANPSSNRIWKMSNPEVRNPITKKPVAYKLLPTAAPLLFSTPDSLITQKGHFCTKNLWVTPYSPHQRFPSGDYVLNQKQCHGLKEWTKEDASLVGADPIIWYSFGVTHVVRIEDFPVMPVELVGFSLKPFGFFTGNPSVDIPPDCNKASVQHCCDPKASAGAEAAAVAEKRCNVS